MFAAAESTRQVLVPSQGRRILVTIKQFKVVVSFDQLEFVDVRRFLSKVHMRFVQRIL